MDWNGSSWRTIAYRRVVKNHCTLRKVARTASQREQCRLCCMANVGILGIIQLFAHTLDSGKVIRYGGIAISSGIRSHGL